jgi:hypothetical protein
MATSASAQGKPAATRKAAPRKQAAAADKTRGGKPLQFRYHTVMKPQRVYPLVVQVPKARKGGDGEEAGVVVVRPVVPGAQVVPAEQRLDASAAGNQVTFYVTPLATGTLPRARAEVHAPGQPPQDVRLPMAARTQRLAWSLLVLAFVLPWLMTKVTKGDWKPTGATPAGSTEPSAVLGHRVKTALKDDIFQADIPFVKKPIAGLPFGLDKFTLADGLGDAAEMGYLGLQTAVVEQRAAPIVAVVLLLLAFLSWMTHRPRKTATKKALRLGGAEPAGEPATLRPL